MSLVHMSRREKHTDWKPFVASQIVNMNVIPVTDIVGVSFDLSIPLWWSVSMSLFHMSIWFLAPTAISLWTIFNFLFRYLVNVHFSNPCHDGKDSVTKTRFLRPRSRRQVRVQPLMSLQSLFSGFFPLSSILNAKFPSPHSFHYLPTPGAGQTFQLSQFHLKGFEVNSVLDSEHKWDHSHWSSWESLYSKLFPPAHCLTPNSLVVEGKYVCSSVVTLGFRQQQ